MVLLQTYNRPTTTSR